jgi:hypothetical protein
MRSCPPRLHWDDESNTSPYQARTHTFSPAFYFRILLADIQFLRGKHGRVQIHLSSTMRRPGTFRESHETYSDPSDMTLYPVFLARDMVTTSVSFPGREGTASLRGRRVRRKLYLRISRVWPFLLISLEYLGCRNSKRSSFSVWCVYFLSNFDISQKSSCGVASFAPSYQRSSLGPYLGFSRQWI